ncbi:2-oxoglutarate dehydrogenase E1 component [Candidatus Symbiobacter mobilis]|uniref:oxoglutarate dehydrogenase (succinyl-transferring) n=1 Tax=Candidatus Symbiobacter mobilis CR TaxID=946483 RepID=U5N595_9BURK|nr:2-oxoglutarate dehydrogenase E1 component [Candidatus Symbiobacter mobilis]AGX86425.1 2-oxoglutarate dehydrogenase E1 component [Candidatus Symbiobacter mobilis CR]
MDETLPENPSQSLYQVLRAYSHLFAGSASYIEDAYERYLDDPDSVAASWREWFDTLAAAPASDGGKAPDVPMRAAVEAFAARVRYERAGEWSPGWSSASAACPLDSTPGRKHTAAQQLIAAHRNIGVRWASLDPLQRAGRPDIPELDPSFYGLEDADLDLEVDTSNTFFGPATMSVHALLDALRTTYCGVLGAEFMYLTDQRQKRWWQHKLESIQSQPAINADGKRHILERLTAAEGLERFLHTKYVGQKRFSLEGGESFIVAMDELIQRAGARGVEEICIGMAHRGRLNVLVNTLGKLPKDLFAEFDHTAPEELAAGDVKYHQGFSSDIETPGGPVHLSLAFNPSHLEVVNPVVEGAARARMDRRGDPTGKKVLALLVHGDAAFAGQGVNQETLALAQTRGYTTGGTVHLIINNQIGFTTSDPRDLRSTVYCTDIVKAVEAPVMHVNGDHPESVVLAVQWALDYRMEFGKDVVVDIVCYRKLGHNEQDTPALTQPLMYKKIAQHPGVRQLYAERLAVEGLGNTLGDDMARAYRAAMDTGKRTAVSVLGVHKYPFAIDWTPYLAGRSDDEGMDCRTAIPLERWASLAQRLTTLPPTLTLHPLVRKVYEDRAAMGRGDIPVDWGMGEHMAFASLVAQGVPVRLSGEDSGRGTFSHRHAVIHDQNREKWDEGTYVPLQNVAEGQAPFVVIDSILSEEAVLGFEYGYASNAPDILVAWEAQFGDFVNVAQVVIDQFLASAQVKWGRLNGLTLLLPHGQEGQGPEHSSARIERFMQLAADDNMQLVQPTTASQIFHVLRRQMLRKVRKPLVVFTPKSLLRHRDAASPIAEFTDSVFRTVIDDAQATEPDTVQRVLLCSGKVYYDLVKKRAALEARHVAIVRIEQLYPFPHAALLRVWERYPVATEWLWVQDEPRNQGAWFFVQHCLAEHLLARQRLGYCGRAPSSSPAVGYAHLHQEQQRALVDGAFAPDPAGLGASFCGWRTHAQPVA